MPQPYYQVDAFTSRVFGGNPAGVCPLDAWLPGDLDEWLAAADVARQRWREQKVPMEQRRPLLLETLNRLYDEEKSRNPGPPTKIPNG